MTIYSVLHLHWQREQAEASSCAPTRWTYARSSLGLRRRPRHLARGARLLQPHVEAQNLPQRPPGNYETRTVVREAKAFGAPPFILRQQALERLDLPGVRASAARQTCTSSLCNCGLCGTGSQENAGVLSPVALIRCRRTDVQCAG